MSVIIEKTYTFLDALDNSNLIKTLTKTKKRLLKNKEILSKINDIQKENNPNELINKRKLIYQNEDYREYMKCYNELLFIIMKINQKYAEYTKTKEHYYE